LSLRARLSVKLKEYLDAAKLLARDLTVLDVCGESFSPLIGLKIQAVEQICEARRIEKLGSQASRALWLSGANCQFDRLAVWGVPVGFGPGLFAR
jgi:hypothetical protein